MKRSEHISTTNPTLSDQELIRALLKCDRLSEQEEEAFRDMEGQLALRGRTLTSAQRQWADAVYALLAELDE